MGNHSISEPAAWDSTTPQVPDAGPSSFMSSAAATIEAFVTILGKRTQYLKALEALNFTLVNSRITAAILQGKQCNEYMALGGTWRQVDTGLSQRWFMIRRIANSASLAFYGAGNNGKMITYFSLAPNDHTIVSAGSSYTGQFNDMVIGATVGAIVGNSGEIQFWNGSTLTRKVSLGGSSHFYTIDTDVTLNFSSQVLIAGGALNNMYKSTNFGSTWSSVASPFSGSPDINAIRFCPSKGIWVMTTSDGKLATSIDGTAWTIRVTGANPFVKNAVYDLANTTGYLIAICGNNSVGWDYYYSSDGTTWTIGSHAVPSNFQGGNLARFCGTDSQIISVDSTNLSANSYPIDFGVDHPTSGFTPNFILGAAAVANKASASITNSLCDSLYYHEYTHRFIMSCTDSTQTNYQIVVTPPVTMNNLIYL